MKHSFFSPLFILLFFENYFFFSSHTSLNMLPTYLSDLGASKGYIGLFMNINPLELVFVIFLFNQKLNALNKRKSLIGGFVIFIISMLLMYHFSGNLTVLLFLRFIAAISFVFAYTMHTNLIFSILPAQKRTGGIALFGISGILANPSGSLLGELLIKNHHPQNLFLLAAAFGVVALIISFFVKDPDRYKTKIRGFAFHILLRRKSLFPLIAVTIIFGGVFSVLTTFLPNFTKERLGFPNLSYYFISFALVAIIIRFFFNNLFDTVQKRSLLLFSLFMMLIAMTHILFLKFPFQLALTGIIYGTGHSIMFPALSTSFLESGHEDEKELLNNAYIAFNTLGNVSIATILGFVGDVFETEAIFAAMIVLIVAALLIIYKYTAPVIRSACRERVDVVDIQE